MNDFECIDDDYNPNRGIVYCLVNRFLRSICEVPIVKIGMTTRTLDERMSELYTTALPTQFECFYAVEVEDARWLEQKLHKLFVKHRVNRNREFFEIDPSKVQIAMELHSTNNVYPTPKINAVEEFYPERDF